MTRHIVPALALLACAFAPGHALATAVASHHEKESIHNLDTKVWTSSSCWDSNPAPMTNGTQLTTSWTHGPGSLLANVMFDYKAMDEFMNTLSHYTQDNLTSTSVQITRSAIGAPPELGFSIDSQELLGAGGFSMTLAAPLQMVLQLSHIENSGGQQVAIYSGMRPAATWLVVDPLVNGGAPTTMVGDGPTLFDIGVAVPEPIAVTLVAPAAMALAGLRRRPARA